MPSRVGHNSSQGKDYFHFLCHFLIHTEPKQTIAVIRLSFRPLKNLSR